MLRKTTITLLATLFAGAAFAHDHEGMVEATLVEVDADERQITVMLEDGTMHSYMLAEDAEITFWDGARERPHELDELTRGTLVELELDENGEEMTVRGLNAQGERSE